MSQIIHTKDFGDIEVERAWVDGTMGIGVTPQGAYVHLSGLPVQSRAELEAVIHDTAELADACYWLEHRHDITEEAKKRVVCNPNGSYEFEDGTPVNSVVELIDSMGQGNPALEPAILWFAKEAERRQHAAVLAATSIGNMTKEVKAQTPPPETMPQAQPTKAPRKTAVKRGMRPAPALAATITV
jgi:hypothetical protein